MNEMMTVSLDHDMTQRLERLAKAVSKTKNNLIIEALRQYLAVNEWHIEAIREGIKQADAGELIPHEEIRRKWETKHTNTPD